MDTMLDRFFEEIERSVKENLKQYYLKVSEMNGSFFVLVKRRRGKILVEKQKFLFDTLQKLTEDIYLKFSNSFFFCEKNYFPYFKLSFSFFNREKRLWMLAMKSRLGTTTSSLHKKYLKKQQKQDHPLGIHQFVLLNGN